MKPDKLIGVDPLSLTKLEQLPNVGPAIAQDLKDLGLHHPLDLLGQGPLELYERLCRQTKIRHDPCVLDVFFSIVRYMEGDPPCVWWYYTAERKALGPFR